MLIYVLGRSLEFTDVDTVDELTRDFIKQGHRIDLLIKAIVAHETFRRK